MADQKGLRVIGFSFAAVTATVMLIAALVVTDAARATAGRERPQTASATAGVS